jgi:hypothetical protein
MMLILVRLESPSGGCIQHLDPHLSARRALREVSRRRPRVSHAAIILRGGKESTLREHLIALGLAPGVPAVV